MAVSRDRISPKYYAFSPFDQMIVDEETRVTATTMLIVMCFLAVTGLIGHCCVTAFITCNKSRARSSCFSAYVIIGNLTVAHVVYLIACLPAISYSLIMDLITAEWLFGDFVCRLIPFIQMLLLGVTTLSFFAFAIDRYRCAGNVDKGYEVVRDSYTRGFCKMIVLWIGAFLLATPELLLREVTTAVAPVARDNLSEKSDYALTENTNIHAVGYNLTKAEYTNYRSMYLNERFALSLRTEDKDRRTDSGQLFANWLLQDELVDIITAQNSTKLFIVYKTCSFGTSSWKNTLPKPFFLFIENYSNFKLWWLLGFYFCLPVFFSLLLALLVRRRLNAADRNINNNAAGCAESYYVSGGLEGTFTSQREWDRSALVDNQNYRTDSLLSNRTHASDAQYQQRGAHSMDRQLSHTSFSPFQARLSPLLPNEHLQTDQDISPTVLLSNGSIRTVGSSRRPGEFSPSIPLSPSLACASGVSVLSLTMSNGNGGGTLGTASLPPHGHRRSMKRSSRAFKQTMENVSRERALNAVLVSFVLAFTLTQLPLRVIDILRHETSVLRMIDSHYVALITDLCLYFSMITYIINPIVLCLCYKTYRKFLSFRCCCCCC